MRWSVRLALVAAVALPLWSTAGDARNSVQTVSAGTQQQLRVAIVIPNSGPFSIHNRLLANGATVAVKEINAQPVGKGRAPARLTLRIVSVRPTTNPARIVRSLRRESTRVLILPCNVELQESLARAAAKAGLLTLSPCNPDPKAAASLPRYWPVGASGPALVGQLVYYARYLYKQRANTGFVLGAAHSWYSRQMISEVRTFAKRNKIKIVGQAVAPAGSHGVARLANRIRKVHPGIVFATVPSPTIESIISGLRQKKVKSAFFVTDAMDASINFLQYRDGPANSSLEDVVFATFGFPRSSATRFLDDYAAAYGKRPLGSFPGLGYETIHVLETAAERATALTPKGLNVPFARGFTVPGVALEDIGYRGHGHKQPVTYVGIAEVIRDAYVPIFDNVAR